MRLELLDKSQTAKIYKGRMTEDFPQSELKPLGSIHKLMDDGVYKVLGLVDNEEIEGYICLLKLGEEYLIDYAAIYPDKRNMGLGSGMLGLLKEYLSDADSIIGEVEDPACEADEAKKRVKEKRLQFYMKNGFADTKVRVICFGEPFILIEPEGMPHSQREIKELYRSFYKFMLPEHIFQKNVIIL